MHALRVPKIGRSHTEPDEARDSHGSILPDESRQFLLHMNDDRRRSHFRPDGILFWSQLSFNFYYLCDLVVPPPHNTLYSFLFFSSVQSSEFEKETRPVCLVVLHESVHSISVWNRTIFRQSLLFAFFLQKRNSIPHTLCAHLPLRNRARYVNKTWRMALFIPLVGE